MRLVFKYTRATTTHPRQKDSIIIILLVTLHLISDIRKLTLHTLVIFKLYVFLDSICILSCTLKHEKLNCSSFKEGIFATFIDGSLWISCFFFSFFARARRSLWESVPYPTKYIFLWTATKQEMQPKNHNMTFCIHYTYWLDWLDCKSSNWFITKNNNNNSLY